MCHTLSKRQPEQMFEASYYLHVPIDFILGKMHFQLFFFLTVLLCLSSRYSLLEIKLELQKNILKFGYGINYKYEGMLAHFLIDFMLLQSSFYQHWMIGNYILLIMIKIANT